MTWLHHAIGGTRFAPLSIFVLIRRRTPAYAAPRIWQCATSAAAPTAALQQGNGTNGEIRKHQQEGRDGGFKSFE